MSKLFHTLGSRELLNLYMTAFFCSRKISATAVLKSLDWATEQKSLGNCVISGFSSSIEKDVFDILIEGKQPIIIVLARCMLKRLEPKVKKAIDEGRLLIVTPFGEGTTRASQQSAIRRNKLIIELANEIVVGFSDERGKLKPVLDATSKPVTYLTR